MIDPNLDHDDKTEPGGGWPVLKNEELDALSERIGLVLSAADVQHPGVVVKPAVLAELVRLYRGCLTAGTALDRIGELGAALQAQVEAAELIAQSVLRGAGNRFEILLRWGGTQSGHPVDCVGWHENEKRFKWRGTFDEAVEIVRSKYGPKRGTEALIVVRVDQ